MLKNNYMSLRALFFKAKQSLKMIASSQKALLAMTLFMILTSGCSLYTVDSQDITGEYYPPKKSADDVIYLEKVDRPNIVVGIITVNTERTQEISQIIEKMKREAALLGADAITDIKTDAPGYWKKLPAQKLVGNAYVRAKYSASAVVFK